MKITREKLDQAARENIISAEQAEKLHAFLQSLPSTGPSFDFTNILYYMGGLIAIGAMTLFMNLGWEKFGGWGIFFIALCYGGIGLKLPGHFNNRGFSIPAGICATFAVALSPLAIYGLQQAMGWWPENGGAYRDYHHYIKWHWIYLELGTLAAGAVVMYLYRFPFLQIVGIFYNPELPVNYHDSSVIQIG